MTKNDNILDELFRSKLNDFEEVPPSYVWMKIQQKQRAGKRKSKLRILRTAGIAAAILLAFLMGWQLQEHRHRLTETPVVAEEEHTGRQAPGKTQEWEAEPVQKTIRESVPVKEMTTLPTVTDAGRQIQKMPEPTAPGQTLNLLTMMDVKIETPEFPGDLKDRMFNDRNDQAELTETDLRIIEMNKQIQDRNKAVKDDKSWNVGALISPSFSVNQRSYEATYASNMSRPGEKQYMTIGGGISVEYKTGKRWSIQSGLHYSRLGQSSGTYGNNRSMAADHSLEYTYSNNNVQLKSGKLLMNASAGVIEIEQLPSTVRLSSFMESAGAGNGQRLTNDNFDQRFEYIEIPLFVRYRMVDRTWNMHMLGGVSANMLVGNRAYLKDGSGEAYIGKTKDMNQMNYSASFGVGLGYQLTSKIQLNVEPQLKYYLQSLSSNPDITFKPYSVGLYTGVSYRF